MGKRKAEKGQRKKSRPGREAAVVEIELRNAGSDGGGQNHQVRLDDLPASRSPWNVTVSIEDLEKLGEELGGKLGEGLDSKGLLKTSENGSIVGSGNLGKVFGKDDGVDDVMMRRGAKRMDKARVKRVRIDQEGDERGSVKKDEG